MNLVPSHFVPLVSACCGVFLLFLSSCAYQGEGPTGSTPELRKIFRNIDRIAARTLKEREAALALETKDADRMLEPEAGEVALASRKKVDFNLPSMPTDHRVFRLNGDQLLYTMEEIILMPTGEEAINLFRPTASSLRLDGSGEFYDSIFGAPIRSPMGGPRGAFQFPTYRTK